MSDTIKLPVVGGKGKKKMTVTESKPVKTKDKVND